jgi:hypothetical protein
MAGELGTSTKEAQRHLISRVPLSNEKSHHGYNVLEDPDDADKNCSRTHDNHHPHHRMLRHAR